MKERLLETAIPSRRGLNKKIVHIREHRVELMSVQIRIKQPSAINIFVLSIIEWPFYTSFTVAVLWSITFGFIDIEMCFMICFFTMYLTEKMQSRPIHTGLRRWPGRLIKNATHTTSISQPLQI